MEEWQSDYITKNLSQLIALTNFDSNIKAELLENQILSQADVEKLDAERDRNGKSSASFHYYNFLMTRVNAYIVLTKALEKNSQSGAVEILIEGLRKYCIPKNFEDGFADMDIEVSGKIFKAREFFPNGKLKQAQELFQTNISEIELYDMSITKQSTFVLANNTIPPEPPLYIPRFLSNRIEIPKSIFKSDCPDVFVFKNNITRVQLSEIARPHWTASSNSLLRHLTARFIYLDDYEDWNELKKLAKVPIHLITYDKDQKVYILEDSSATLDLISKVGSKKQCAYLSEDEFIQQQLFEDLKVSSVCICDTPGMGKTFLLANIARIMKNRCTGTIFAFIQLSTLVQDFCQSSENNTLKQEILLSNVLKYVSPSSKNAEFLVKLVHAELLQVEIFFDGFDEIPQDKIEWMKTVFLSIKGHFSNVRMYITSRPHMRHELEKSLGVIAYDILPFNIQNQADYLVRFWSPNLPELDRESLTNYALSCLKEIHTCLTKNDKEIAGIPLLCRLIAEICANKVHFYSTTGAKNFNLPVKIAAMYQQFIQERINAAAITEEEQISIKMFHIWHALKLIFPTEDFHRDEIFAKVNQPTAPIAVLKAGIIQLQSNTKLEFLHRTFAEYFVAEYFCTKLHKSAVKIKMFFDNIFNRYDETKKCLAVLLATLEQEKSFRRYSDFIYDIFVHAVIVSFVDFSFNQVCISEITKTRIISFCASIPPKDFIAILCSCCHHNFYNLFELLKEPPKKWDWNQRKIYFTTKECFKLLDVCIRQSTSQMFHSCIQLFTEVLKLDIEQIATHDEKNTLLHRAAKAANYEAVEYLLDRVSLQLQQGVLEKCVEYSNTNDLDMLKRRENILYLLHNKNPTLISETRHILRTDRKHLRLFKQLVKLGAQITAATEHGQNCAWHAALYMSPSDYHELVEFLLTDYKAEYLFVENEKWKDPLPEIIKCASLLPETLQLLLNIPGIDITKKDKHGDNLLFYAVYGRKLDILQQLVDRGLDYNARGMENRSLLHVAAKWGEIEMVRYVMSLKLDPNSRDKNGWTPLHFAAEYAFLSVVEVLVEDGANVQATTNNGLTALHLSAAYRYQKIEIIKYLIERGVGVNDRDNDGNTPLHFCIRPGKLDCLIEMGADIHAKNKMGQTPAQKNPDLWK